MMRAVLLAIALLLSPQAATHDGVKLASGWLGCAIRIEVDGSATIHRVFGKQPVSDEQMKEFVKQMKFQPHVEDGQPMVYYTGVYIRYRVVQRDGRRQMEFGTPFLSPEVYRLAPRPWPEGAWEQGLGGDVVMDVDIDGQGIVSNVRRIGGDAPDMFTEVALEAVRGTEFVGAAVKEPAEVEGELRPVASRAIVDIYYEPSGRKTAEWRTKATVPLDGGDDTSRIPVYHNDLPPSVKFREFDETLEDAVAAWDFPNLAPSHESITAEIINRRSIVPAEGKFLFLPNSSPAARVDATR